MPGALWQPRIRSRLICLFGELFSGLRAFISSRNELLHGSRFRGPLMSLRLKFLECSGNSLSRPLHLLLPRLSRHPRGDMKNLHPRVNNDGDVNQNPQRAPSPENISPATSSGFPPREGRRGRSCRDSRHSASSETNRVFDALFVRRDARLKIADFPWRERDIASYSCVYPLSREPPRSRARIFP